MDIEIEDEELVKYFVGEKSKYSRLQKEIKKKTIKKLDYIESAKTVLDLSKLSSLNFELLEPKTDGIYSIRVDRTYRLELRFDWIDEAKGIPNTVYIIRLSKHYKKI
ncbi:MAG: type II toxin-antitoxin system RelE/ParE family toxin [bacterium]